MTRSWDEAAERYRRKAAEKASADARPVLEMAKAAEALNAFMSSPSGTAAKRLLAASGRHIIFGEEFEGSGYCSVYFLNGDGLQRSFEGTGTWIAYASDPPKPILNAITAEEAVRAAVEFGDKDLNGLMEWLSTELDGIAESAP